ncbi:MAG: hypothetical protein ACREEK_16855 [Bradyrhizobium sp.]
MALLLACGVATAWFGSGLKMPATTARDGAFLTFNRYAQEPIPDVVLVGSSITNRLSESYFSTPKLRNLALAGGSPVTGLEIVAARSQLPKLILVEANVLARAVDTSMVDRYSRIDAGPLFFRPIRAIIAAYENRRHAPLSSAEASAALEQLVKAPPADLADGRFLQLAVEAGDSQDPGPVTQTNAASIARLAASIEQRGSRLMLFELPVPKEVAAARFATITRKTVRDAFPGPSHWLPIEVARDELRWPDGVHLDARSAVLVARSIDRAIVALQGR